MSQTSNVNFYYDNTKKSSLPINWNQKVWTPARRDWAFQQYFAWPPVINKYHNQEESDITVRETKLLFYRRLCVLGATLTGMLLIGCVLVASYFSKIRACLRLSRQIIKNGCRPYLKIHIYKSKTSLTNFMPIIVI